MVTAMVRPRVWFVRKVKPILLVTLQVKILTHQPDLIQGSDTTMGIREVGNLLGGVSVEDIRIMKSRLMILRLFKEEMDTRMATETILDLFLPLIEDRAGRGLQTPLLPDTRTMTLHTPLTHHIRLTTQLSL